MTVSDVIQCALLSVVVAQLWVSHRIFLADHERRKKTATFEFVNATSDRFREALNKFDAKHGTDRVIDITDYDDEDEFLVKSYLNEIERISAGVNAGVFDYDILKKMMGGTLMIRHHRFTQYIQRAQAKRRNLFVEFDELVRRLSLEDDPGYENIGKILSS